MPHVSKPALELLNIVLSNRSQIEHALRIAKDECELQVRSMHKDRTEGARGLDRTIKTFAGYAAGFQHLSQSLGDALDNHDDAEYEERNSKRTAYHS